MNLPNPVPEPAVAFALLLESACQEFETLQGLLAGDLHVVAARPGAERSAIKSAGAIRMAYRSFNSRHSRAPA